MKKSLTLFYVCKVSDYASEEYDFVLCRVSHTETHTTHRESHLQTVYENIQKVQQSEKHHQISEV